MGFADFFRKIFAEEGNSPTTIKVSEWRNEEKNLCIEAYALFTVIDFIASLMSNIELQTYYNGKATEGFEWVRLNIKPNKNQNAKAFWKEFWCKLLYYQEVLVVTNMNEMIIADSFSHHPEYAIMEDYFEGVSRGSFTFSKTFKMSEVYYMSYSTIQIQNAVSSVLDMYSDMVRHAYDIYDSSGGEKGILNVNSAASGPEDFEAKYGKWINNRFKSYFKSNNAVMPLFKGMTYTGSRATADSTASNDVNNMIASAISRVCNAYKVSPALMMGNISGAKDAMVEALNFTLTSCIDPLAKALATEITGKQFTNDQMVKGCSVKAFTNNIKHTDVFDVATSFDKLFADGFSHNQLCKLLGMPEQDGEWANAHHITKNYSDVNSAEYSGKEVNDDEEKRNKDDA